MILRRLQNYRQILLTGDTVGEAVGMLRRDGSVGYRPWRGFVDVGLARTLPGAVPVKRVIDAFLPDAMPGANWTVVPAGHYLQGCLLPDGAWCVLLAGVPRLVSGSLAPITG